ncbi:hypothetical protein [Aureitalea marina]|uniref:Uncharacterized protein n=1 Tax=Aureitalea marina TaxID=930804 RepID=A0A2S7KM35_9FLAO|nr:hypothetical protein [Aureitalea marina]PQB03668.1 hypothetical protein BST85_01190 [Aureitalea marina]
MAPIKFEDNIREKLQNREIEPSSHAWNKLDQALGKPPKRRLAPRTWWAIAASVMILIFLGSSLLQEESPGEEIAEETIEQPEKRSEAVQSVIQIAEKDETFLESETVVPEKDEALAVEETEAELIQEKEYIQQQVSSKPEDVVAVIQQEEIAPEPTLVERTEETFVSGKVDEVVAQVQALQLENKEVSPEEVEALLDAAQREIANRRVLEEVGGKVDPMALLMDVESEMERSFRDKVFDALGDGFDKVRTAVAERNN